MERLQKHYTCDENDYDTYSALCAALINNQIQMKPFQKEDWKNYTSCTKYLLLDEGKRKNNWKISLDFSKIKN